MEPVMPLMPEPEMMGGEAVWGAVCADGNGEFWDEPGLVGAARSGMCVRLPRPEELSPLPDTAQLQFLPGRHPLVWPAGRENSGRPPLACTDSLVLAAQLPSGWTRTLLPAWYREPNSEVLPIFGYTAVFYHGGRLWCAAVQTEQNPRWDPCNYALPELQDCIAEVRKALPGNRIIDQLDVCATQYGCYNAQNIFYGRWEGAAPISPVCNAGCRGCISKQPDGAPPSPQIRLNFTPTVEEIAQLGLFHIGRADRAIFTFGQGCEGEPLMQADTAADAIRLIRSKTSAGTLHMNSNGSRPEGALKLFEAGLNSMRVSMCSAIESSYNAYYRPRGYSFSDVLRTLELGRQHGVWMSINLLLMPGLNDTIPEIEALIDLIKRFDVNMVQMRNLNIDPDWLFEQIEPPAEKGIGITNMIRMLQDACPGLRIGSHNPAREEMGIGYSAPMPMPMENVPVIPGEGMDGGFMPPMMDAPILMPDGSGMPVMPEDERGEVYLPDSADDMEAVDPSAECGLESGESELYLDEPLNSEERSMQPEDGVYPEDDENSDECYSAEETRLFDNDEAEAVRSAGERMLDEEIEADDGSLGAGDGIMDSRRAASDELSARRRSEEDEQD